MNLRRRKYVLDFAFLTLITLVWLVPVAMMVAVSVTPSNQRALKFGGLFITGVSWENYAHVFRDTPIVRHLFNSVVITVTSVALVVTVGSLAAYAFARLKFVGKEFWFYVLIVTLMLPIPALVVPIFRLNKDLGLLNSYFGLILPYTALGAPFAIIILRSFFESLPKEVEEAALLEGSSRFDIYWRIVMPMSWPALSVVVIFQFLTSFNEFILALVTIDNTELKPLTLVPLLYADAFLTHPGDLFAVLTIITIPVIVVYVLMQRFLISGLTAGGARP
jgi:ABC-type glycerol-3-phosphate transport system permease component